MLGGNIFPRLGQSENFLKHFDLGSSENKSEIFEVKPEGYELWYCLLLCGDESSEQKEAITAQVEHLSQASQGQYISPLALAGWRWTSLICDPQNPD